MTRIALCFELPAGNVPTLVELIPAPDGTGTVRGRDGRSWAFDGAAHAGLLSAFAAQGRSLPIDINHSTEIAAPKGGESPAAGWINQIEFRDGALLGAVEWTPRGAQLIADREYRYLSPVFEYQAGDKRVTQLISAALTNAPNLRLPALNHQEHTMTRSTALTAATIGALALTADASDDALATAINALKADGDTARAANAIQPSPDTFVPRADYDTAIERAINAEQRIAEHAKSAHATAVDAEITAALAARKIAPASVEHYRAICAEQKGFEAFKQLVASAPVIAPESGLNGRPSGVSTALNSEQREAARLFGMNEAQYLTHITPTAGA